MQYHHHQLAEADRRMAEVIGLVQKGWVRGKFSTSVYKPNEGWVVSYCPRGAIIKVEGNETTPIAKLMERYIKRAIREVTGHTYDNIATYNDKVAKDKIAVLTVLEMARLMIQVDAGYAARRVDSYDAMQVIQEQVRRGIVVAYDEPLPPVPVAVVKEDAHTRTLVA